MTPLIPEPHIVRNRRPELYYSLLFLEPAQRQLLLTVYALEIELKDLGRKTHSSPIALQKMAWWYEELKRTQQGHPSHPLTIALIKTLPKDLRADPAWTDILEACHHEICHPETQNLDHFLSIVPLSAYGPRRLTSVILGLDETIIPFLQSSAMAMELTYRLQSDPLNTHGLPVLPVLQPETATYALHLPTNSSGFTAYATTTASYYQTAYATLPTIPSVALQPLMIATRLSEKLFNEILRTPTAPRPIRLPPLSLIWTAWRTQVRTGR